MEQPFEDAGKAMTSQVPRAGAWCDGGHHDDDDDDDDDVSLFLRSEGSCLSAWAAAWLSMSSLQMEPSGHDHLL